MLLRGRLRRRTDAADADGDVLLLQGVHDISDVEALLRQQYRVQPNAHRVLTLTEDANARHARYARQIVDDVELRVVAQLERIVVFVARRERDAHNERAGVFRNRDAELLYAGGQLAECGLRGVLNVGSRDIEVGFEIERQRDRRDALGAGRRDIAQALNRVDGLLDRGSDLSLNRLRAGTD